MIVIMTIPSLSIRRLLLTPLWLRAGIFLQSEASK
jgi:hypothetical protein